MKLFGVLISTALVLSTKAFSNDYSWQVDFRKIAHSEYIVNYDEPTETLSFFNPKMGMDVTFDGARGVFAIINTTSGNAFINYPHSGTAKFVTPNNKYAVVETFRRKDLTHAFKEAAKVVINNWLTLPLSSSKFDMTSSLAALVTNRNNDDVFRNEGRTDLLNDMRADTVGLKASFMKFLQRQIYNAHNSELMLLGAVLNGDDFVLRINFLVLMSTLFDYFNGKFNKELMRKVYELIIAGARNRFTTNIFNTLIAAISMVGPLTLGIDNKVHKALSLAI